MIFMSFMVKCFFLEGLLVLHANFRCSVNKGNTLLMSPLFVHHHPFSGSHASCSPAATGLFSLLDHPGVAAALDVIRIMKKQGYTALIVGGAVRDILLERPVRDVDLAADMPSGIVHEHFKAFEIGRSRLFHTLCIVHQEQHLETTLFRKAGASPPDRPEQGETRYSLFSRDAMHRDFTINAMALDENLQLLDPFHGKKDLGQGLIRAVENPRHRMTEDPLRMLRGVRLACELGFEIEDKTTSAISGLAGSIPGVAPERLGREILKMASLSGPQFARGLRLLDRLGLLPVLLPEVEALKGLHHDPRHHPEGDVFRHTLRAIQSNHLHDDCLNMALLAHDLGKAGIAALHPGRGFYRGHDHAAENIIRKLAERLRLPGRITRAMQAVAANHMRMHGLDEMRPSKILEMVEHPYWPLLARASVCDHAARGEEHGDLQQKKLEQALKKIEPLLNETTGKARPVITGKQVMQAAGISPGPRVGRIIRETTAWARDNGIQDQNIILDYARSLSKDLQKENYRT